MLKICTVYFKGFYTPDYVSKLYRSLKRNSTIPFQFICISDTNNIEADVILPYNHHSDIKKHWHKLKFFSPQFGDQEPGDDIIIMDIDQVITNNVDEILSWQVKDKELLTYDSWWNNKPNSFAKKDPLPINGGFYKFKSGSLKGVWDDFSLNPNYWQLHYYNNGDVHYKYYGEQNYVNWKLEEYNSKITKLPGQWVIKYTDNTKEMVELNMMYAKRFNTDYMLLDDVNKNVKMVHFLGINKDMHTNKNRIVKKYWK